MAQGSRNLVKQVIPVERKSAGTCTWFDVDAAQISIAAWTRRALSSEMGVIQ